MNIKERFWRRCVFKLLLVSYFLKYDAFQELECAYFYIWFKKGVLRLLLLVFIIFLKELLA